MYTTRYQMSKSADASCCVIMVFITVMNVIFGGMSVNYLLSVFAGNVLPGVWAIIVGLFVGEFTIPLSIVVWILKHFQIF